MHLPPPLTRLLCKNQVSKNELRLRTNLGYRPTFDGGLSVAAENFGANYVAVIEVGPILSVTERYAKESSCQQ